MKRNDQPPRASERIDGPDQGADARPAYEPPRIVKKRSVARVTLFTGGGPPAGGLPASG